MIGTIKKEDCTGCKMCADICPKSAIIFKEDYEGFWYPQVDSEKCIKCELCIKKCPSLNFRIKKGNQNPDVYSLWSKNDEIRISSTSGGAFWEFASFILENGGVVAGCIYDQDWRGAYHGIATTVDELVAIKGSKYFQSDTAGIYKKVKKYLDDNVQVLFCGTPCQNAALNAYLSKEYDNLINMDFICRSINSPKAFKAYIDELEQQYNAKVIEVHLKNKDNGWQSLASQVKFNNGEESVKDKNTDYWVRGFIYNDLYTRESCYHCKHKVLPRSASDLTIGDFWGIKNQNDEAMFKGISVLLVNSDKGTKIFDCVKDRFIFEKHTLKEVLPGNPALINNPIRTKKQDKFFNLLNSGKTFSYSVEECIKKSLSEKLKGKVKAVVGKLRRVKELFLKKEISISKYIYYNYLCRHIERKGKGKLLPHKNAILNFDDGAKIILEGKDLEIGFNKLKGSKKETLVRLNENAVWHCKNGGLLFYDTVLEIKPNAVFESGFFSVNGGSVIIIHKKVIFGEDVMLGRNVIVYDSDFHSILNRKHIAVNIPKPVIIEDHVWLTTNVMVQKGVTIGRDSLIAAYTVVNKNVPPHSIIAGKGSGEIIKDWVAWDREICPMEIDEW